MLKGRYAECCLIFIVMLNVVMLSVIMLSVVAPIAQHTMVRTFH
jgi:hypothetical protein